MPTVSVVVPTLNAERHLEECFAALEAQEYDGEIELIVPDAGSADRTREIATAYGARLLDNPGTSGEAGKAVGVKAATGEVVLLLDSDNILIGHDWLERMVRPLAEDPNVVGCEPARFVSTPEDHFINRWHALIGAADPLTVFTGNYARDSVLTGTWTGLAHASRRCEGWERVEFTPGRVPVFGANGFVIRRSVYEEYPVGDFLFDLDYVNMLVHHGHRVFARADVGIRHLFCDSVAGYRRKTRRRVDDFFFHAAQGDRSYPWTAREQTRGVVDFVLSTVLVAPVVSQAVIGYRRAPDRPAWAWHVAACWITLGVYAVGVLRGRVRPRMLDRKGWHQ